MAALRDLGVVVVFFSLFFFPPSIQHTSWKMHKKVLLTFPCSCDDNKIICSMYATYYCLKQISQIL